MNPGSDALDPESTVMAHDARKPTPKLKADTAPVPQHCMAMVKGSGQHYTDEVYQLLRQRLRLASTIAFCGFLAFFLRNIIVGVEKFGPDQFDIALHGVVVAVLAFVCGLLWTSYTLCHRTLRIIEAVMFGSMALYFADLQFRVAWPGLASDWAVQDAVPHVMRLANSANNVKWFFLIVLYGMFIPNTWQRCAGVVGCLASIPIILTLLRCPMCDIAGPYAWTLFIDTLFVLGFSSAMAIFGSYRISSLAQEAYQARKLGQYQLHRKLGSGGMGEVYLGEHLLLKRTCAIKLIRPEQAGDPTTLSRFEREVQSMATLTHPNTVEVYDYGRTPEGTFYYVMEFLPGLSLQELVETYGPLPPGRAIHFLRQICGALREAHSIGLIHRDIKPSNVIACQRGGVHDIAKLLDFGLVQDVAGFASTSGSDKLTVQGAILGSPNYISPEQAAGNGRIDARTDIYSLGGLAYFLITGQTPFVRETAMELIASHMRDEVVPPRQIRPELPADLEEIILMCLRKNADDRFSDAESLDLALAACDAAGQWDDYRAKDWWQSAPQPQKLEPVA